MTSATEFIIKDSVDQSLCNFRTVNRFYMQSMVFLLSKVPRNSNFEK
jgi:hypothetical protein